MHAYGRVGRKGALYPPKKLREELELKEGDMVKYIVEGNSLLVVKISNPLEVASKFNISFDTKIAMSIISEIGRESEGEIEEEILKTLKNKIS
ncbi:AbrB/MazE/SpoVT family DNA-binding domain-containing protein [Candidatus Bathyarchaeota archaeon]|nr:AbrB/MazE/SpoVT family DNA-binding domain-containing protein [Candidatus Bathyarchaeota archaeon]